MAAVRELLAGVRPLSRKVSSAHARIEGIKPFTGLLLNIGAMKAGTTWLFNMFEHHPDLCTVPIKEIHYLWEKQGRFPMLEFEQRKETILFHIGRLRDLGPEEGLNLLRWCAAYLNGPIDDAWYFSLFPNRDRHKYCVDFSNLTAIADETVWDHCRRISETLRVNYILRQPLDRLWSHVCFHARITGHIYEFSSYSSFDFEAFLDSSGCLDHGKYADIISKLKRNLNDYEINILYYDEIKTNPQRVVRDMENFLNITQVDIDVQTLTHVPNPTEKVRMPDAFRSIARPFVEQQIEALQRQGTPVPAAWLSSEAA